MSFNKKIASAITALLVFAFSAANAFAGGTKNNFVGKTYVMTGLNVGGMDVTALLAASGFELNMEVTFVDETKCIAKATSDGNTEESTCKYKVDTKAKTLTLCEENGGENLVFNYTDDYSTLSVSAPIQDGMTGEIILTEKSKAGEKAAQAKQSLKPEIDYGSVKTNIFKGKTYKLTKLLINGMDATSLMALSGGTFSGSLKFIDGKHVILDFTYGGDSEKDSGTYTIDYEKNQIIFDGDKENCTAVFYNKGSVISFDFPLEENMTFNMVFEK